VIKKKQERKKSFHWMTWQKWCERERTVNERKLHRLAGVVVSTIMKLNGWLLKKSGFYKK